MTDPPLSMTTGELARLLGAELRGPGGVVITGVGAIERAGPSDLTFIRSAAFAGRWADSSAGAALVSRSAAEESAAGRALEPGAERALLIVADADGAMVALLEHLEPLIRASQQEPDPVAGVHPTAHVERGAEVDPGAWVGPQASIGRGAVVGEGAVLHPGARVGPAAVVGARAVLHANAVLGRACILGDDSVLHAGAVVGADGFGYVADAERGTPRKVPHVGVVVIGKHVEVGAATAIDRAKFGATSIGDHTKIDNLVQIAHNCEIGRCCVICGCSALAGSVTLGDGVTLGGAVSIADNVTIGDGATLGAQASVMHDMPAGETWLGVPARPARETMRILAASAALPDLLPKLKRLLRH